MQSFAPSAPAADNNANHKNHVATVSVGVVVLVLWAVHLIFFIRFILRPLPALVVVNTGSLLVYGLAFLLLQRNHRLAAIVLVNLEISTYCLLNVWLLGWDTGTQWFLPSAMLLCQTTYALGKRQKTLHIGAMIFAMLGCYLLRQLVPPLYPAYNNSVLVLLNVMIITAGNLLALHFSAIGSKVTELYYKQRIDHLSSDVYIDSLTRLWNRRYAMQTLDELVSGAIEPSFSIAMMDVDFFKKVNDTHGHPFGDIVLQQLSDMILSQFRSEDIAVRWGGEEFMVILSGTDSHKMLPKLEEFRIAVQNMVVSSQNIRVSITITIGVSEYQPGISISDLIAQSDLALYYGKNNGRNQVVLYKDMPATCRQPQ